jgi:hypothetical protein
MTKRRPEDRFVKLSEHAIERCIERLIPFHECQRIIRGGAWHADGVGEFGDPKWIAAGYVDGAKVEVVFVETPDGEVEILEVVTVYREGWSGADLLRAEGRHPGG